MSRAWRPSAGLVAWVALMLTVLAFTAFCAWLIVTVRHERDELATRVEWLHRAQDLVRRPLSGAQISLRIAVSSHPGAERLAAHLEDPDAGLDAFVRAVRTDLSERSTRLGERWDALNLVALAALVFAGLSLVLLAVLRRRQRAAEADRARFAGANAELVRLTEAARAANEEKTRIVTHISHEFRTPMQAIMGMVNLLEGGEIGEEHRRRYLATLRMASEDLLRLIDGLLDVARIESGKGVLRADEFSPRAFFEQITAMLEPGATKKGLALGCELPDDLPQALRGDRLRLRQVVINLVGNAIKFTRRGQVTVRVKLKAEDGTAQMRVEVADTGPGLTLEAQAKLFEPFVRAHESGLVTHGGSGLGLSISKQLIEMFGGRLGVESTPGIGSVFWFEVALPIAAGPPRTPEPARVVSPGTRVLVVDDDAASRALLTAALERVGYSVDGVADGRAAVDAAQERPYAAIVLDVELPGLAGPDAARRIRSHRGAVPLVALTGHTDEAVRARCKDAGIDEVLIKPVELEVLRATIARVLSERAGPVDLAVIRGYVTAEDPTFVPGLIDVFLQEADRDVAALQSGQHDPRNVAALAHRLKGSSSGFGARALAECCQALHVAARGGSPVAAELAAVVQEYARVRVVLVAERARLTSAPAN